MTTISDNRADHVLDALRRSIAKEIDEAVKDVINKQAFTVHGLSVDKIEALAGYFRRETGLDPVACTVADIKYEGEKV